MNRLSPTGGLESYGPNVPNHHRLIVLVITLICTLIILPDHTLIAQIELKSWELQNNLGNEPNGDPLLQADVNAPGICSTCGDIRRGGGLGIPPTGRLHTIVSNNWDAVTLAEARSFAEYYKISIRPAAGNGIRLTSIALRLGRTTNGPNRFGLFSNVNGDNFLTQIGQDIVVAGTSLVDTLYFPDSLFANCTVDAPIDFRLYAWVDGGGQDQFAQAWIGNVGGGGAGNDVIISGFVEPEPMAFTSTVFSAPHCYGESDNLLRRLQVGPNTLPGVNEEVVWRILSFTPGVGSDMSAFVGGEFTSADNIATQDEFQIFNSGRSFRPVAEPEGSGNNPLYGIYTLEVFVRNTLTGCTSAIYGPLQKEIKAKPQLVVPAFPPTTCSNAPLGSGAFSGFAEVHGMPFISIDVALSSLSPDLTAVVVPTTGNGLLPTALDGDTYTNLSSGGRDVIYTITLNGDNGCVSDPTDFTFRILAEPQGQIDTLYRCSDEETGLDISLIPGSWGDVNGPPNLVLFNLSINSNGLVASAGNPADGSCLPYTEIADDAWTNSTTATVPVIYTLTPVRGCDGPDPCFGQSFEIIVYVAPQLNLYAYETGTNIPVADPILICENGVNLNMTDVAFDLDSYIDVQPGEFMRYFWLGVQVDDPNAAGISNTTTLMGSDPMFPLSFNPGLPSLLAVTDDIGISDPLALVEPVNLTYIFGGPVLRMADGHICGDNDPANWTEVHARIVPSPEIEFVYPNTPSGNEEMVCNGSANQVFLTLNPEHPDLEEGVDYVFELNTIFYSTDGINFLPGYGPLTGGSYSPSPAGLVEEVVPGIPGLMETLSHNQANPVWIRYEFQTTSLDPQTNCDSEPKTLNIIVQPRPYITCPADMTVSTGFDQDCTAEVTWMHPVPAPACEPIELYLLTENGVQMVTPGEEITMPFTGTGNHVVQYDAYDASGYKETCSFNILVIDEQAPVPYCTQGLTVFLDEFGKASITPDFIDAGSTDNCGIDTITLDRMDFTCDDIGINAIILTVEDQSGNSDFCETSILVEDPIPPIASCTPTLVRYLDENGQAEVLVSDVDDGSYDACGIASVTLDKELFTCADKGDNIITLTVIDSSGNINSCQTLVSIIDQLPPVLTCPDDQVITLDPGLCRTVVNYNLTATDNCPFIPLIEQTAGQPSGSVFERGLVNNCFRVFDNSGNAGTCCFTIEVLEYPNPNKTMVCNDLVQISLDEDCISTIGADLILEGGPYGCYDDYQVMIFTANNQPLVGSPNVGAGQIGKTLIVKVTDPDTGNSCWGAISVEDKMPPVLNCPMVEVQCGDNTDPDQLISPDPATSDNCDAWTDLTWEDEVEELGCQGGVYTRIIHRNWLGVDESGNKGYCVQEIKVIRPTLSILDQLENYDGIDQPVFDCSSGYPSTTLLPFPGGNSCGVLQVFHQDKVLPVCSGSYTLLRTWTVLDMCLSEVASRIQTIKVIDQTPPQLTCPDPHDIVINKLEQNGYQECTAKVLFPMINVTDNCSVSSQINIYVIVLFPDGSQQIVNIPNANGQFEAQLPIGKTYQVSYIAIDNCGNKNQCSFPFDVKDVQGPVVVCETFHIVSLSDSVTQVNASTFDDGSWDTCTPVTFSARRMDNPLCAWNDETDFGPTIPFYCCDATGGPMMVEMQVADAYGNVNSCMVEVQVVDKIKPQIWCPEDITVQCGMPFDVTPVDTFEICVSPKTAISSVVANTYVVPLDITGIPSDARITDLDLGLHIQHEYVNQLSVTLYSPLGKKATVMSQNACPPPTKSWYPMDIQVTFNDEAYDLDEYAQTGIKIPAPFTCLTYLPNIGSYNQGQMQPQDDPLIAFDGQPLNSVTEKDFCFTVGAMDINAGTNRIKNAEIGTLISGLNLANGDKVILKYVSSQNGILANLSVGQPYLFQVIDATTLEFLDVLGVDIVSVPAGSSHQFCLTNTWMVVVRDHAPLAGGMIHDLCMSIEYVRSTGLKPHVTDNTEACGLDITWQDLNTPDQCADGTFINRRWRAADQFGNSNTCLQRVYFEDESPLVVQFPCDVTINCENLEDLNMTGDVIHNGDCEQVGIEISDQKLTVTDACYKIMRTWTVKNNCAYTVDGNVDYTLSSIDLANNTITFTAEINTLINQRKLMQGDPLTLRYVTSISKEIGGMIEGDIYQLIYQGGTSFEVLWNSTKQQSVTITNVGQGPHLFRYANSSLGALVDCADLQTISPLTNWNASCSSPPGCRAWEDDGDGYFSYIQEIKVVDNDSPKLIECHAKEYCSLEEDCSTAPIELIGIALDNCTPQDQLKWTYLVDAFNDGSIDISGVGKDASGIYPLGTHAITWKVSDQCGNQSECTQFFIVKDCLKPTPICHAVSIDLMPLTGMAEVWATSLEVGESSDNCTSYENLTILVERFDDVSVGQNSPDGDAGPSILVTCDDLPPNAPDSIVTVAVWVGDEAGNWDYCVTTIAVQDWMGACGGTMNAELTGYVSDESGEPVELVEMDLTGNGTNMSIQTTGNSGAVSFGTMPAVGQYTVTPQKDINPLNGVSTYDLLQMQKHLLGIKSLNSPYKLIAADVNNNCTISISDIIELRKMILAPGTVFANNTSWRFVEAGYVFPNPNKPCNFMGIKNFGGLQAGMNSAAFVGVKIGDVSGDATPNSLLGVESRNAVGALEFAVDEQTFMAGETFTFEVKAGNFRNIQGYQYTIGLDPDLLQFVRIDAEWTELSGTNFGQSRTNDGLITTSWNASEPISLANEDVLYRVTVKALVSGKLSEAVTVNSKVTRAEAYDVDEELLDVHFRFDNGVIAGGDFVLYQNEPNPFGDLTRIGFYRPSIGSTILTVHDVTGNLIYRTEGNFNKGYNEFILRAADVSAHGMLYYTVQSGDHVATRRMIMQE
ncbi:MAG: HYR domain-containing protein [Saprospiraceae bacterium]|nr:HYR domain-containing protein [Saprospiraceae bacterium]